MPNNEGNNHRSKKEDLVFFIRIQYRCNSSWQGTIQWMDGKQQVIFRSALELGNLINSARQKQAYGSDSTTKKIKWDEKEEVS